MKKLTFTLLLITFTGSIRLPKICITRPTAQCGQAGLMFSPKPAGFLPVKSTENINLPVIQQLNIRQI